MHRTGSEVMVDATEAGELEPGVGAAAKQAENPAHASVPLGTAARWIVALVSVFVIAIWLVLGFLLWVPLLTRMIFVFTAAVMASMYTGRDPTDARNALEAAMSFYSRGFVLIFDSMKGDLQKHGPFVIPESAHMARMFWELVFSVLFWLGVVGILYWFMGFSIWLMWSIIWARVVALFWM